jgi:CRISPR-associated endoribonuclease Cas6
VRIHLFLSPNDKTVPFDYQHYLVSTFHKWLGKNTIHDEISLYSLSWLQGGSMVKKGFEFPKGAQWFISFWEPELCKKVIGNIREFPSAFCGMSVNEIQMHDTPAFGAKERFIVSSPVLIRKYDENQKAQHLTYADVEADFYLTETLKNKLKSVDLNWEVSVKFDRDYIKSKTKMVNLSGIHNRANFCPVIIEGNPEAIKFAWNVGIGHSTGCGFGALL